MKAACLFALVLVTHYSYYGLEQGAWWFYILRGIEGFFLFLLLARESKGLAVVACLWGAGEEAQTAVCGYLEMGNEGSESLCLSAFGPLPYLALAAALFVVLWRARDGRTE